MAQEFSSFLFPPVVVLTPGASEDAVVQATAAGADGLLCTATGSVSGTQISGTLALCQPLANEAANPTLTADQVRNDPNSITVGSSSGPWSGVRIPRARYAPAGQVQWNALVVYTYFYGFPPPTPLKEVVKFKGVQGTCTAMGLSSPLAARAEHDHPKGQNDEEQSQAARFLRSLDAMVGAGGVFPEFDLLRDLIRTWWQRDVNSNQLLREPVDKVKGWYLYRDLPVDIGLGAVLGLDGRPLRATSISVAIERMTVRRDLGLPSVHVATPLGTGETAINQPGNVIWNFERYSTFGVVILQRETLLSPKTAQQVISVSRKSPTDVFVDPRRPIHVAVNSPRLEDWMNVGVIDAWVRVNTR